MIRVEHHGPRLDVILDDPEKLNAQTAATWRSLASIGAAPPEEVRVIVLRGEGTSFSAGLDKAVFAGESEPNLAALSVLGEKEFDAAIAEFQRAFTVWRSTPAIVIAVVQGYAIGAGFQLALAADLRVVGRSARFSMRETSLGIVPDLAGTEPLLDIVGYSRALEICVTGRWVGAKEASDLGLATIVVDDDQLAATTDDMVSAILAAPQESVIATKQLLAQSSTQRREQQRSLERQMQAKLLRRT